MKNLYTVMVFTMKEMMKKKSFIISTLFILIVIIAGFSIPKIIKTFTEDDVKEKILISDINNVFEGNIKMIEQMKLEKYEMNFGDFYVDDIKKKVDEEEFDSALVIEKENEKIKIRYILPDVTWVDTVPEDLMTAISTLYSNMQINKLGLTQEQLNMLTPNFELSVEQSNNKEDISEGNTLVMMALSFVLFMAVMLCITQVAMTITTEKTSKIIETLVTSTSPKTIVLGKTIGIGLVGLFQILLAIVTAVISAKVFLDAEMIESLLDMSHITFGVGAISILYFILGYSLFALLFALSGSMVSKMEDIQSANTPISMIAMIGFYLGYFSIAMDPTSSIGKFAGIFPISSPFCMPSRIMMGLASTGEIIASIVLLFAMVILIAIVAIKIYSNAILNYGSKLGFKDLIRLYFEK